MTPLDKVRPQDFAYRREAYPAGTWRSYPSPTDCLFNFVLEELDLPCNGGMKLLYAAANIPPASASRFRRDKTPPPVAWVANLAAYSGVPFEEMARVAFIDTPPPHHRARK